MNIAGGTYAKEPKGRIHQHAMEQMIATFLSTPQIIAVVGMSPDAARPSRYVPEFLERKGHTIIPIHPILKEIGHWRTKRSLREAKGATAVLIYMSPRNVDRVVEEAIKLKIPWIWLPLGVETSLAEEVSQNGLVLIQDRCPKIEWERLNNP